MAEKTAFEEVYEQNFKYVYNVVYMRVMHKETAEDITGDMWPYTTLVSERLSPRRVSLMSTGTLYFTYCFLRSPPERAKCFSLNPNFLSFRTKYPNTKQNSLLSLKSYW